MKIEFYHVDAFEIANFEPVWRKLVDMGVDARIVAVPDEKNTASAGWFDFARFKKYCDERSITYSTRSDPTADVAVTTQNADILREYKRRVRLMYGPIMYPSAWGFQPHTVQPFDAVLTHGPYYAEYYSRWLPHERLPIVGYPRYDDFFSGIHKREQIRSKWGIKDNRPALVFLPTWGDNTGFDTFYPELIRLADKFNIILRPHHCTVRMEPERMNLMRSSGLLVLDSAYDLSVCYAGADIVVSDVRSGALFESCLCNVPTVGMVIDPAEMHGWLEAGQVGQIVSLCSSPQRLADAIDEAMSSTWQAAQRQRWVEQRVSYREGNSAQQAAETLIKLAVPSTLHSLSKNSPTREGAVSPAPIQATPKSYPVKVSIVLPTYNHAKYLPQALQSILNQTFDNYELIIVNDGSTDETAKMLANIKHPKFRIITKPNQGLPAALNTGFDLARGEYWTWTSADNIVGQTWLEELVEALDKAPPDVGYALSYYADINDRGQILGINKYQCFETHSMLLRNGNASFLYRSEVAKRAGLHDVSLSGAEDLDMWLRISLLTRAVLVESVLYYYRLHDDSMTAKIPEKIHIASRNMIQKFVDASDGKINIDRIFPGIGENSNPAVARWQAKVWLAGRLFSSSWWPPGPIVDMLIEALKEQYTPALVGNIVHLFATKDAWNAAAEVVSACLKKDQSPFMIVLAEIVANKDKEKLKQIPFVTIPDSAANFDFKRQLSRAQMTA